MNYHAAFYIQSIQDLIEGLRYLFEMNNVTSYYLTGIWFQYRYNMDRLHNPEYNRLCQQFLLCADNVKAVLLPMETALEEFLQVVQTCLNSFHVARSNALEHVSSLYIRSSNFTQLWNNMTTFVALFPNLVFLSFELEFPAICNLIAAYLALRFQKPENSCLKVEFVPTNQQSVLQVIGNVSNLWPNVQVKQVPRKYPYTHQLVFIFGNAAINACMK